MCIQAINLEIEICTSLKDSHPDTFRQSKILVQILIFSKYKGKVEASYPVSEMKKCGITDKLSARFL